MTRDIELPCWDPGHTDRARLQPMRAPVIDLSSPNVASQIDEACRAVDFFQIVGHDVRRATVTEMREATDELFRLPEADKRRWCSPSAEIERGYSSPGSEAFSYSLGLEIPPDLLEAFTMGRDAYPEDNNSTQPVSKIIQEF